MLMIFIDGLGVGAAEPKFNPCAHPGLEIFNRFQDRDSPPLPFGGMWCGADANLGVEGLPQSATGQTSFMTGENAPARLGRHANGLPDPALREMLAAGNILLDLKTAGKRIAFLNAYRPEWFVIDAPTRLQHSSVTTIATQCAGLPFLGIDAVRARRCLYQDFTNSLLVQRGIDVPIFSPEEAGQILASNALAYDFVLFEYFQTDIIAHRQSLHLAYGELRKLERFLMAVLRSFDLERRAVLVVSDHGNIEDTRTGGHTNNPAMVLAWGKNAHVLRHHIESLVEVHPAVLAEVA